MRSGKIGNEVKDISLIKHFGQKLINILHPDNHRLGCGVMDLR